MFGVRKAIVALTPSQARFSPGKLADLPLELRIIPMPGPVLLHAKFYYFEGPEGAGAVMGSPNVPRPRGWYRRTQAETSRRRWSPMLVRPDAFEELLGHIQVPSIEACRKCFRARRLPPNRSQAGATTSWLGCDGTRITSGDGFDHTAAGGRNDRHLAAGARQDPDATGRRE